jgi:membrane-associated phospholipid phosphatase
MSVRRLILAFAALAFCLLWGAPGRADDLDGISRPHARALRFDMRIDLAVTLTAGIWLVTSEILKGDLVPEKCRWCSRAADGAVALNPYDGWIRDRLVWRNSRAAQTTSSVLAFAAMPALAFGASAASAASEDSPSSAPVDALIIGEAALLAANLNQFAKYAFARERPFVRFLPSAGNAIPEVTASPSDDNLSFFSGHTTLAFAVATSTGTVASLRAYRSAPLVWAGGLGLAGVVGYLRIAADKHYLTDVMTAVVVGSVVGVGVPLLFHGRRAEPIATTASGGALALPPAAAPLGFRGVW